MDDDQQFCLRWNNHQSTILSVFDTLLENETLVDCTLAAEGKFLKAHKVVLSACSPYFATLLSQQYDKHPIFILKDVKFQELRSMMEYMYRGEVNISQDQLAALLKAAESLQIKGLSDSRGGNNSTNLPSQAHLKCDAKASHVPAPKASGLTTENKRPQRTDFHPDVAGSREGSVSPSARKRKKVNQRRKSLAESNSLLDNHDQHSNSSSHSNNQQQQPQLSTSATSAPSNMSVTNKKTEHDSNQQDHHEDNGEEEAVHISKRSKHDNADNKQESELMIEPKNEYDDDDDEDGNVEDLTMDDEMLEDLDQAGPSHGGEGSSQGYHWQMDGRSQESQEAAGQHRDAQGDGGDTNTINLDKYFYFPENNSDFSANNFKIALPNPPPQTQSSWVDFASVHSGADNGVTSDTHADLPPLTEIKQEKVDEDYEVVKDIPVWHTAKSTSKITMYPSKEHRKTPSKRKLQQIQPKPPALTPAVMPPLTQIIGTKPSTKLITVVKKIVPIQPKPVTSLPQLTQINPKPATQSSSPDSKLVIKKVSHMALDTRRHSTGNSSKIVPTKELLESLKQENIIYQDNEDKPWYCKTCGRNYKWRNSLKQHIKNECGVPPKYHCVRKCGYKTHIHSNLKRHLNSKFCKPGGGSKHDDELDDF